MRRVKKLVIPFLAVFFCLNLSGCWNYQEADETAFVLALGVDQGKQNRLTVTVQIAVAHHIFGNANGAGGGGGNGGDGAAGQPSEVVSVEAPDILSSINMINTFVDRRLSFKHTKAVIISESLAREEGVEPVLAALGRFAEFRRAGHVVVCRGETAAEFLRNNQPTHEENPSKFLELMFLSARYTAFFPRFTQFHYFYNAAKNLDEQPVAILASSRTAPVGEEDTAGAAAADTAKPFRHEGKFLAGEVPRRGGDKIEFIGAAVFNGDKMVGSLTGEEVAWLLMIRGGFREGFFAQEDPLAQGKLVTLEVFPDRKTGFKVTWEDGKPAIEIKVSLEGSLQSVQSTVNYEDPAIAPVLEEAFARRVEREMMRMVDKIQKEYGSDVLRLGWKVKRQFLTWKEWEQFNWPQQFTSATIKIKVGFKLRRYGLQWRNAPVVQFNR